MCPNKCKVFIIYPKVFALLRIYRILDVLDRIIENLSGSVPCQVQNSPFVHKIYWLAYLRAVKEGEK